MAKIIILGDGKDADAAKAALEGASIECEIVKPTAANLLHIVIGMVDDEPEEKEEKEPKAEKPEEAPAEEPKAEAPAEEAPAEEVPESLGKTIVADEVVEAIRGSKETSTLFVKDLIGGSRTTYTLNESTISFWPADAKAPAQRMQVEFKNHRASVEVKLAKSGTGAPYFEVGADLIDLFTSK